MAKNINAKGRRKKGKFFAFPHVILTHSDFISLSNRAIRLLIDLGMQFNGFNNGDLCAAMTLMKKRGWRSNDQLTKAKNELLDKNFILLTLPRRKKKSKSLCSNLASHRRLPW